MQRKSTKQSRGSNSIEKRFMEYCANTPCDYCGNNAGQSRVDHCVGSSAKQVVNFKTIHIGHIFCLSECAICALLTHAEKYDKQPHHILWQDKVSEFEYYTGVNISGLYMDAVILYCQSVGNR